MRASTDRSSNHAITYPMTMTDDHERTPKPTQRAPLAQRLHTHSSAMMLKINVNFINR
jgi:hypothetical protein